MSSEAKNVVLVAPATAVAHAAAAAPVTVTAEAVCANNNKNNNKNEWTDVQFKEVVFPSQPKRSFRVTVQRHEEVTLVVEDNQTHEKWASVIEQPAKHGPDMPMPTEAFIAALETSIKQLNKAEPTALVASADIAEKANSSAAAHAASAEASRTGVSSDMVPVADAMNLTLRMQLSVFWEPEYTFHLAQIGLKTVDLLVAQVRDLQEKVRGYEEKERLRTKCHLDLSSNSTRTYIPGTLRFANSGKLVWIFPPLDNEDDEAPFTLTEGNTEITVNYKGWYIVDSSIKVSNGTPTDIRSSSLVINGHEKRTVTATGQGQGLLLYHTAYLKAGDKLRIHFSFHDLYGNLSAGSTFTIHLLD